MNVYLSLIFACILPTILTIVFELLNSKTSFNNLSNKTKQIIYGVSFGLVAVYGTEFGIKVEGAVINVRDAAVLTAGLMFGGPAGIIAGLIGGIERFFAVYWGISSYTRIACTVSTSFAGFLAAFLRKYMFDDKRPTWSLALSIGVVMEVIHMTMVFLTNMDDVNHAMMVVKTCSVYMIPANALGTAFSCEAFRVIQEGYKRKEEKPRVAIAIQRWLLLSVSFAFLLTTFFSYTMQTSIAKEQAKKMLQITIKDVAADVEDASNNDLLLITKSIVGEISNGKNINELRRNYGVSEISIIDKNGIIINSTSKMYVGYDMRDGDQSSDFMRLLDGQEEYVQSYGPISYNDSISRKYCAVRTNDGFIQVGIGAEEFQGNIKNQVSLVANNKHIGESGYVIVADTSLSILSATKEHKHEKIDDYGINKDAEPGILYESVIDGEECLCMYTYAEGYYIIALYPVAEAYHIRGIATYVNVFMEIMVFSLMFGLIFLLIKVIVVNKIRIVNKNLNEITNGNLDVVVNVRNSYEFDNLSNDINATVAQLKEHIKEAVERIDAEIEYAKNIQESALPHVFPESEDFEIYALMDPAKGVGGDFYDFFRTSRHTFNFLIADVSGKGIPGAMFMMRAKSELHSLTETGVEVNEVFTYGNNSLCEGNDAGMFVTAWEGCIDLETGVVKYANAGHNPPVIVRKNGECEFVKGKAGFVLAGMDGIKYPCQEIKLEVGDILFLYTDGVVEANNVNNELYGDQRLLDCLNAIDKNVSMEYLCCEVIGNVGRFVGDAEQFDDITMLAIKYKGNNSNK